MPCRSDDSMYRMDTVNSVTKSTYDSLKKETDNVTRLLCSVLTLLEKHDFSSELSRDLTHVEGLREWWENHKEVDRRRIEKEVNKAKKTLESLSPEAKNLLAKQLLGED